MTIDLRVTFSDGAHIISKGWPDQPIVQLFNNIIKSVDNVILVEVEEIHHN